MKTIITLCSALMLAGLITTQAQPTFIAQPQSQSVSLGVDVVLYAQAYGSSRITYQWRKDGVPIPGATLELLPLIPLRPIDQGDYDVIASNLSGSVTSQVARIVINPDFYKITTSPIVEEAGASWSGSWGDYDNDGWLDLFIAHDAFAGNTLYRNNRDGTFSAITSPVNEPGISWGAAWGDANNDGLLDLVVANFNNTNEFLFQNTGNGGFIKNASSPVAMDLGNTFSVSWVDTDNDGWLDIYSLNYPQFTQTSSYGTNFLYRNNRDGTYTRVANPPGNDEVTYYTSAVWADYDNDGRQDMLLTRLGNQPNFLYRNVGGNQFTRVNDPEFNSASASVHSFGGAWGDYDNDGYLDLLIPTGSPFVSSHACLLFHNNGNGTFTRITNQPIVTVTGRTSGAAWGDYDNDGWLDAFVSYANQQNILWRNNGNGTFDRITTGSLVSDSGDTRGCAWGDYDNDGFLDLFVAGYDRGNLLYRNSGNSNAWLKVQCVGRVSNRLGAGAKIRVAADIGGTNIWQMREISAGCTLGSHPYIASFGLGSAAVVDTMRVEWPSGIRQILRQVPTRQALTVQEPSVAVYPPNPGAVLSTDFTFSVAEAGAAPIEYQWFFNDVEIPDSTNATLLIANVQTNQLGSYRVRVRDVAGTYEITTVAVSLRAAIQPVFTTQPQPTNQSVSLGASIHLRPAISGTGPLQYQWRLNDADLPGATNLLLSLTNIQVDAAGRYQLIVKNPAGAVTSQVVTVQVDAAFTKVVDSCIVNDGGASFGAGMIDLGLGTGPGLVVLNGSGQAPFLYQNDGAAQFSRVSTTNAPELFSDRGEAIGVAVGDYDNDGRDDLFVVNYNARSNFLYHAEGKGTFAKVDAGELTTVRANHWSAAWGDANRDGWLDLFIAAYGPNQFFLNNGDGTFTRQTNSSLAGELGNSRACSWVDYDNDGDLDLFYTNLGSTNNLFRNNGDGTFVKITTGRIVTDFGGGNGLAWGDYDNDGDLDLMIAKNGPDFFYENNGDGTFTRITTGVVTADNGVSWAAAWVDYDNDGWLDLYVANSGTRSFYRNNGNRTFTRITSGSLVYDSGDARGCAWGDFNQDGFADLFVSNYNTNNALYLNNGNGNHWLKVKCVGAASNRSGIGAKVRVLANLGETNVWQVREISSGDGLGSQQLTALFGLGSATNALTVRVEWPSGAVQELHDVAAGQFITVAEPGRPAFRNPHLANGQFQFQFTGGSATECLIQTSTNLKDWEPCLRVTNIGGEVNILRPETPGPQRFYRAISQ